VHGTIGPMVNTLVIDIMPPKSVLRWWWWWFLCMSRSISGREACSYYLSLNWTLNDRQNTISDGIFN